MQRVRDLLQSNVDPTQIMEALNAIPVPQSEQHYDTPILQMGPVEVNEFTLSPLRDDWDLPQPSFLDDALFGAGDFQFPTDILWIDSLFQ